MQVEKEGFDYVWITDHFNNRNVYVTLTMISNYTDRISLGPGVTNPYLVHPVVTGQILASLDEIAPGRVVCGLGIGDKTALNLLNIHRRKPLSIMREAIHIIREISSGKNVEFEGLFYKVVGSRLNFSPSKPIPIFVGAQGPKMISLAAELGDGVLVNASHPKAFEKARTHINEGILKAGKAIKDIEIAATTCFSISRDVKAAEKAAKPVVAFIVAGSSDTILQEQGISIELVKQIRTSINHAKFFEALSTVKPEMMDAFSIFGTPEICVEKIHNLTKAGITLFIAGSPLGPDIRNSIELISKEIIPHFKNT